jgi:hypothetical protein
MDNALVPLTFALVERENRDSWSWFLCLVWVHAMGPSREVGVISDRHQGILNIVPERTLGYVSHPVLEGKPNANLLRVRTEIHVHSDYIIQHYLGASCDSLSIRGELLPIDHYLGGLAGYHYVAFTKIPMVYSWSLGFASRTNIVLLRKVGH